MEAGTKSFAFKLAQKNQAEKLSKGLKWKARNGVSVAGCTPAADYEYRSDYDIFGQYRGQDNGYHC